MLPGKFETIIIDYLTESKMVTSSDGEWTAQNITTIVVDRDSVKKGYPLAANSQPPTPDCKGNKHDLRVLETGELKIENCKHPRPASSG
jgi:hypothetical protein